MTLAQSIKCLPSLAELVEGASSNLYFVAASHAPTSAVQWANKVEVSTIFSPNLSDFHWKHRKLPRNIFRFMRS